MATVYFIVNILCLVILGIATLFHPQYQDTQLPGYSWMMAFTVGAGIVSLFALSLELLRPPPLIQAEGDCVRAVYVPRAVAASPEAEAFVGRLVLWKAMWVYDKGKYKGTWAMTPVTDEPQNFIVPLNDLIVQERRK